MSIKQLHDDSMSVEVNRKWHRKPSLMQNLSERGCKVTVRANNRLEKLEGKVKTEAGERERERW